MVVPAGNVVPLTFTKGSVNVILLAVSVVVPKRLSTCRVRGENSPP